MLFVSFRIHFLSLNSDLIIETIEKVFPCSRILYLCLESLGLDIISVIFNRFKNGSNKPLFVISFCERIIRTVDSCMIHFWSKEFYQFKKIFFLHWKIVRIGSFRFLYQKYIYEVCSNVLIGINPRPLPRRNE